jgi:hypothetical protein
LRWNMSETISESDSRCDLSKPSRLLLKMVSNERSAGIEVHAK